MKEFFIQWGQVIQLAWNIVTISAFFFLLIWLASYLTTFPHDVAASLEACKADACKSQDSFAVAAELGRLDILSICLTILGVLLAILALFGFLKIERDARVIAKEEACNVAELESEKLVVNYLDSEAFKKQIFDRTDEQVKQIATDKVREYIAELQGSINGSERDQGENYFPDFENEGGSK